MCLCEKERERDKISRERTIYIKQDTYSFNVRDFRLDN